MIQEKLVMTKIIKQLKNASRCIKAPLCQRPFHHRGSSYCLAKLYEDRLIWASCMALKDVSRLSSYSYLAVKVSAAMVLLSDDNY